MTSNQVPRPERWFEAKQCAGKGPESQFQLRIVEGAGVALYRHRDNTTAEIVPTRMDLFKYPGGFGWGYGGSGATNLSYAIASKLSEHENLEADELHRRARLVLDHVISDPALDVDSEYNLSAEAIAGLFR